METRILDGYRLAVSRKQALQSRVEQLLAAGKKPVIAAILFTEDSGSVLYTDLKREMAESLGIGYQVFSYSLQDEAGQVVEKITELSQDSSVTGIIVQKPWRNLWIQTRGLDAEEGKQQFAQWWESLITAIEPSKDVDGLHPSTLEAIKSGNWQEQGKVLPATCKAVLSLLEEALETENLFATLADRQLKTVILGKSDLLGQPLFALLQANNLNSEIIGSSQLNDRIEQGIALTDADIIVSATGRTKLVTGELIKENSIVIDVGEPQGDVDAASVLGKALVLTPVPGGVGPMTVVSLMENALDLVSA